MGIDTLGPNADFLEELWERFQKDPNSVDPSFRTYFASLKTSPSIPTPTATGAPLNLRVAYLISSYRTYGHLMAKINPIRTEEAALPWQLQLERFGFTSADLSENVPTNGFLASETAPLKTLVEALQKTYSGTMGIEYRGVQNPELEEWLQERVEPRGKELILTIEQKKIILEALNKAELFEIFLHTKYTGQKRFSLEGGETLIPILSAMIEQLTQLGASEFVIGMAHRGRLNVLSNILNKSYAQIFTEFDPGYVSLTFEGSGDVKYHKGFSAIIATKSGKKVKVDVAPNPSHLESVNPIVEGEAFAIQTDLGDREKRQVIPILVHGDAAISGQGVVYETMQLAKLKGYGTGGTLHVVINNQIGFTTLPEDGRSTYYCTDIAKAFLAPVFHVNAEDPEGCFKAALLAAEIRQTFGVDVFIDLNCWRKFGHNEADEPAFTQPKEYRLIRNKASVREQYRDDLISRGVVEKEIAESLEKVFKEALQKALSELQIPKVEDREVKQEANLFETAKTAASLEEIREVAKGALAIPPDFHLHKKLERLVEERREMVEGKRPIDWGTGEMLALGTLLLQGKNIRLTGQDTCRGTFSHRHAVWMDQETGAPYIPLEHIKPQQGKLQVINSPLSENACLGFEYGYSIASPDTMVFWEAQFGDFANGAQVVIDQYIATGEQKWNQKSSLILLLPHAYEGQGPEHSSGRIERFLALCGDNNMIIANVTTPAQLFHLLRRQALWKYKKPLVVFTPKGLLRHPECISTLDDLTKGSFEEIIDDPIKERGAERLIFCSGHIYYDLLAWRKDKTPIIRFEQLFPFHEEKLKAIIKLYPKAKEFFWVQEEPKNMGPYGHLRPYLHYILPAKATYVGRKRSASPATGSHGLHERELETIKSELFGSQ